MGGWHGHKGRIGSGVKDNFFYSRFKEGGAPSFLAPLLLLYPRGAPVCTAFTTTLQLVTSARLHRAIILLIRHALPAPIAMPPQRAQPLAQDRVAEVVRGVHPVCVHGAQVLDLELDEGLCELGAVAELLRELVGLELVAPGEDVHQQLDHGVHGGEGVGEEDEADDDGHFGVEAEGAVEGFVVDEDGEEGEDVEEVDLGGIVNMFPPLSNCCVCVMHTCEIANRRVV